MARRPSKRGAGAGGRSAPRPSSRLPDGRFAWRGKARAFSELPAAERSRWRSIWGARGGEERAARATELRRVAAEEVVVAAGPVRGEKLWGGARADVLPGVPLEAAIRAVAEEAAGARRGSLYARLSWPAQPGQKATETIVSLGFRKGFETAATRREWRDLLDAYQHHPAAMLNREKSGRKGKPTVVEVGVLTDRDDERAGERADAAAEREEERREKAAARRGVRSRPGPEPGPVALPAKRKRRKARRRARA